MRTSKRYEDIFDDCCLRTPIKSDNVVSWRPSGPWTIFVREVDGTEYEYNGLDQTLHVLWQTDNDSLTKEERRIKFGYALGRKMRAAGHDAITLARETGIHQATIYRYLKGESEPSYFNVLEICKVLHCATSELGFFI